MKRLTVRFTPDPDRAPAAFRALASTPSIAEARLLEFNPGGGGNPTALFAIDGDLDALRADLEGDPAVGRLETTAVADGQGVALVTLRPDRAPLAEAMVDALIRPGLVVDRPVIYRDGSVRAELIGTSRALQAVLDGVPPSVSVEVETVGEFGGLAPADVLSDRQRAAIRAGIELGYYDVPRRATHAAIAERLNCAPSTASEHLQKAEAKLITSAMADVTS